MNILYLYLKIYIYLLNSVENHTFLDESWFIRRLLRWTQLGRDSRFNNVEEVRAVVHSSITFAANRRASDVDLLFDVNTPTTKFTKGGKEVVINWRMLLETGRSEFFNARTDNRSQRITNFGQRMHGILLQRAASDEDLIIVLIFLFRVCFAAKNEVLSPALDGRCHGFINKTFPPQAIMFLKLDFESYSFSGDKLPYAIHQDISLSSDFSAMLEPNGKNFFYYCFDFYVF